MESGSGGAAVAGAPTWSWPEEVRPDSPGMGPRGGPCYTRAMVRAPVNAPSLAPERSSFVGRERELRTITAELQQGSRLLTIAGPSGMGKTRLARQVMRELAPGFEEDGGAWICELATCRSPADIEIAAADSLGLAESRGQNLAAAMASRGPMLLVLDNLDGLATRSADLIRGWLDCCIELQILVTSIVPIGMEEELLFELGPLEPKDAVALFHVRARRAWIDRPTPEGEDDDVDELVRRLDRLPLAIELAAARIRVLPPRTLLARFDERFELLRNAGQERHSSLHGALSLTWELLSLPAQTALMRFSVFEGGFTFEAASALVDQGSPFELMEILDLLRAMALVQIDGSEPPRFSLLESVKAFASHELARVDTSREVARRHAIYFVEEGERQVALINGAAAGDAIHWLLGERANLMEARRRVRVEEPGLAARIGLVLASSFEELEKSPLEDESMIDSLRDARRAGEPALIVSILRAQAAALVRNGRSNESLRALEEAAGLARAHGLQVELCRVLVELGKVRFRHGTIEAGLADLEEAQAIAALEGEKQIEGLARMALGQAAASRGDHVEADRLWQEAHAIFLEDGDLRNAGKALVRFASSWTHQGRFDAAIHALMEARALFRRRKNRSDEAWVAANLGGVHLAAGNLDEARSESLLALDLSRRAGVRPLEAMALSNLGLVSLERRDLRSAESQFREAAGIFDMGNDRVFRSLMLPFLALVVAETGRATMAEGMLDAARSSFRETGDQGGSLVADVVESSIELTETAAGMPGASEARRIEAEDRAREYLERARDPGSARSDSLFPALRLLEQRLLHSNQNATRGAVGEPTDADAIRIGPEASWFKVGDREVVSLRRRKTLRRMLHVLVETRLQSPGLGLSQHDLFDVGWEGEKASAEAAAQRVYFGIWTLRSLGMGSALINQSDGYLLDPSTSVTRSA